jgi:hypothetical protein
MSRLPITPVPPATNTRMTNTLLVWGTVPYKLRRDSQCGCDTVYFQAWGSGSEAASDPSRASERSLSEPGSA